MWLVNADAGTRLAAMLRVVVAQWNYVKHGVVLQHM
jgi:hypothetical protein